MKLLKKWLSLLLVFCMMVGYLPMPSNAAAEPAAQQGNGFYRIVHLDAGRKYFTPQQIKDMIDVMAKNDMNQLQLYLSDNQGFRFGLNDMNVTTKSGKTYDLTPALGDGYIQNEHYKPSNDGHQNPYLTEAEMTEIIAYAKSKGIEIVPCINMPGHMGALLNPTIETDKQEETHPFHNFCFGSSKSSLKLTDPEAVEFALAVLEKYAAYFEKQGCKFYNIGADEYAYDAGGNVENEAKFVEFMNKAAAIIKEHKMVPRAFNDAFAHSTAEHTIDKDYEVCYWAGKQEDFNKIKTAGYELINTSSILYWAPGSTAWTEKNFWERVPNFNYQNFTENEMGGVVGTVQNPAGVMFCIWNDDGTGLTGDEVVETAGHMMKAVSGRLAAAGPGPIVYNIKQNETLHREFALEGVYTAEEIKAMFGFGDILNVNLTQVKEPAAGGLAQITEMTTKVENVVVGNGSNQWLKVDDNGALSVVTEAKNATVFEKKGETGRFNLLLDNKYLTVGESKIDFSDVNGWGNGNFTLKNGLIKNKGWPGKYISLAGNKAVPTGAGSGIGIYRVEPGAFGTTTFKVVGNSKGTVTFDSPSGTGVKYTINVTDGKAPDPDPNPDPKPDPDPEPPVEECKHPNKVTEERVEATTTQNGHYGKVTCQDCGKVLNEGTVIPKVNKELTLNVKEQHKLPEQEKKPVTSIENTEIATLTVEEKKTEIPGEKPDPQPEPQPGTGELTQKTELKTGDKFIIGDGTNFIALKGNELIVTTDPAQAEVWELGADGSYKSQTKQGQYLHFSTWNATLDLNWNSTVWQLGAQGINSNAWYIYLNSGKWGIQAVNDPAFKGVFAYDVFTGNGGGSTPDPKPTEPTTKTTYIPVFEGVAPGVTYAEIDGVRYKITVNAEAHEHNWVGGDCVTPAKCSICGIEGEKVPNIHKGPYTDPTCSHGHICQACGVEVDSTRNPDNHEGPITPANCQSKAYCAACQKYYGEKDMDVHTNTELRNQKAATATEPGYSGDLWCIPENKLIQKGHTIPALGEKVVEVRVDVGGTLELPIRINQNITMTENPNTVYANAVVTDFVEKKPAQPITNMNGVTSVIIGDGTNFLWSSRMDDLDRGTIQNRLNENSATVWTVETDKNGSPLASGSFLLKSDTSYISNGNPSTGYLSINKWITADAPDYLIYDGWTKSEWTFKGSELVGPDNYKVYWDSANNKWTASDQGQVSNPVRLYTPPIPYSTATMVINGTKEGVTYTTVDDVRYKIIVGDGVLEHEHHYDIPATCKHPSKCTGCEAYNPDGHLNPENHTGATHIKGYRAPTETEEGYSGDVYCKDCGVRLRKGEAIPVRRHLVNVVVTVDGNKKITVDGDVTNKVDKITKGFDSSIADVQVTYDQSTNKSTISVTGKKIGATTILVNNIRYDIAVTPDNISGIQMDVNVWITNNKADLPGDRPNLNHDGNVAHISAADYPGVFSKDGMVIADILPLRTTATLEREENACNVIFWKGMLHTAAQRQYEHANAKNGKAPDNSFFGDLFYLVRYNLETNAWQVAANRRDGDAGWIDVGSDLPEIYYLQETIVTKEVDTRVVDWGVELSKSDQMYNAHTYVLLDFAVYTDGVGRTPLLEARPKPGQDGTIAYHCAHEETKEGHEGIFDDKIHQIKDKNLWMRRVDTIYGYEKEQYEVYMITLTRTSDTPTDKLTGATAKDVNPYTYGEGAGEEKIVWTIDQDTFASREGRTTVDGKKLGAYPPRPVDFDITDRNDKFDIYRTVGGDPIVDYVQIYENQGMLVTYYLRAKETTDSLKVHYRVEGQTQDFHHENLAVTKGTYFDPGFAADPEDPTGLTKNELEVYYQRQHTVNSDLTDMMDISSEYRTGSYTFNQHIGYIIEGDPKEYTKTEFDKLTAEQKAKLKEVVLYYDLSNKMHFIPLDFGNPARIDRNTIGDFDGDKVKEAVVDTSAKLEYGKLMKKNGFTYYVPTKVMLGYENPIKVTLTIDVGNNETAIETHSIVFMPATNVYYEESFAGTAANPANPDVDTKYAQESTCFDYQTHNFGFDPAMKDHVSASCGTQWETKDKATYSEFKFKGTGVEIYANCDPNTALARVMLFKMKGDKQKLEKMFVVDTHMEDGKVSGSGTSGQAVKAYNVPIVSIKDLPYGEYTIMVSFNSAHTDPKTNQPKTESVFIDGFRVFNPMQDNDQVYTMTAGEIYDGFGSALAANKGKDVSEKAPVYHEMRDLVLAGVTIPDSYTQEGENKGVYADEVAKKIAGQVIDMTKNETFSAVKLGFNDDSKNPPKDNIITDLIDNGPKNEVYLWPGESLVFAVDPSQRAQLGMKALDKTVHYKVNAGKQQILNASTDMFYPVVAGKNDKVTITNKGDGILSVTLLKLLGEQPAQPAVMSVAALEDALVTCGYALRAPVEQTVTFHNGDQTTEVMAFEGETLGELLPAAPARDGFKFLGWNTAADGSGQSVTADTVVNGAMDVYAIWEKLPAEKITVTFTYKNFLNMTRTFTFTVEEGQSIQAPAVRLLLIPYRVNWKSTVGDLHVKSRQSISYDQLSALLGGNVTEGAQVSFVNGK